MCTISTREKEIIDKKKIPSVHHPNAEIPRFYRSDSKKKSVVYCK